MASLELVKSSSATSVTEIEVTNVFDTTYNKYLILGTGHVSSTNSVFDLQFLDSGGTAITSGYRYGSRNQEAASQSEIESTSDSKIERIVYVNNGDTFFFKLMVYNPAATQYTLVSYHSQAFNSANITNIRGGASLDNAAAHSGFKILDATFTDINIDTYGVKD